jgi:hypothetical protein
MHETCFVQQFIICAAIWRETTGQVRQSDCTISRGQQCTVVQKSQSPIHCASGHYGTKCLSSSGTCALQLFPSAHVVQFFHLQQCIYSQARNLIFYCHLFFFCGMKQWWVFSLTVLIVMHLEVIV